MLKAGTRVRVLGAMSGTSLDGVDAAVIETDGADILGFGPTAFRPYSASEQAVLRAGLGQWNGPAVEAAAEVVETAHAELLSRFEPVDLVGFHGQTLAHDPAGQGTLQVGDGAILAEVLGWPVVWDFRTADVQLGGEGAPLAPFYHFALARHIKAASPVAFLNLGGVGNLTWVDPSAARPEDDAALLAFDTGPANAPINDLMWTRRGQERDEGGALAATGQVHQDMVDGFLGHSYFLRIPPKSLDRDAWGALATAVADLTDADAAATLTACAAQSVAAGLEHCPSAPSQILVTGGGRQNATLMAMLRAATQADVAPVEDVGLDGDMLEAQAFAFLAARVAMGHPTSCPGTTGVRASVGGGTVSRPGSLVAPLIASGGSI